MSQTNQQDRRYQHHDKNMRDKWTANQRCSVCATQLTDCDWCVRCQIELYCAQTPEGLAAAELRHEEGERVLYLALAPKEAT
jgi:hypothetical protein